MKVGRNDICPCGSGKKYKKCCLNLRKDTQSVKAEEQKYLDYIREKHIKIINCNENLSCLIDEFISQEFIINSKKQFFANFCLGKAYKTHKNVIDLCKNGYGEDAAVLSRSIFDFLISLLYILKDSTDNMLDRYFEYDWVVRQEMYEYAKNFKTYAESFETRRLNPRPDDDTPEKISEKAKEVMEKYKYDWRYKWSDKSINKMAEAVGRGGAYKTVYNLQSQLIHTSPRVINDYVKKVPKGFTVETGPTENWVEESLVASFDFVISILKEVNKLNGNIIEQKIIDLESLYLNNVDDINN